MCFFLLLACVKSQVKNITKLDLIQGVCKYINEEDENGEAYILTRGMNLLSFGFNNSSNDLDFPFSESIGGFHDNDLNEKDSFNVKLLKNDGLYFIDIEKKYIQSNGSFGIKYCVTPIISVQDNIMTQYGDNLFEFEKISKLPYEAVKSSKKIYIIGVRKITENT